MRGKNKDIYRYLHTVLFFLLCIQIYSKNPVPSGILMSEKNRNRCLSDSALSYNHPDSIHRLNLQYPGEPKGFKPYIAPALLISGGTAMHFMTEIKENLNDYIHNNFNYSGSFDDYAQYTPLAAAYAFKALGIQSESNFGNMTAIAVKSFLLNGIVTDRLKHWTNSERPGGELRSFPSGHTSKAFCLAHLMHREYGKTSIWYSIGAYSCATAVGLLRLSKGAHWISDVLAGAGTGMLSTELIYLTHLYKWDSEHLKHFDIFPFQSAKQRGVTLVYKF